MFIVSVNFLVTSLNLLSPYYINQIIDYIEHQDRAVDPPTQARGLTFLCLLLVSQTIFYLASEHLDYT